MQLSAANLIIASQQLARSARPQADGQQFAQLLAKGAKETAAFEAIDFKPAAATPPTPAAAAPAHTPAAGYGGAQLLGGNLDIRV